MLATKYYILQWNESKGEDREREREGVMASNLTSLRNVHFCLSLSKPQKLSVYSVPLCSFMVSHMSAVCSARQFGQFKSLKASSEGLPTELVEDSKFVPLNADDPTYGPPALLLLGFEVDEDVKIRQLLKDMDGEFLEVAPNTSVSVCALVIYCTEDMIRRSLWEAVNTKQPNLESLKIAKSTPRICFLSGLSGEEMIMFMDAFAETDLESAVFAAVVPNSADKPLQELIEEIMGDHEMLSGKQSSSA
ncbi:Uncharacterized conserved protein UCP014543 [Dillenia turbinata]|uniref:Uncharacterized conserved protein UCP014543 n=1 Tax=Dillenia turbinata TaxID=194707 RepID=A0AAN8ZAV6_9MAGN